MPILPWKSWRTPLSSSRRTLKRRPLSSRRLELERLEDRLVPSTIPTAHTTYVIETGPNGQPPGSAGPTGFTPAQIQQAYGINQLYGIVGNGTGQTIAIVDAYDDPAFVNSTDANFNTSDLHQFDVQFGLADPPSFIKLNQTGGAALPGTDPASKPDDWEAEEALDVEWVHAVAPGANIILFEANSASGADLYTAVATAAATPGVSVVSMSFGSNEFAGETATDSTFMTPAGHQGVTFLASTGDSGSPGGFPAYSPNVIAVGGTSLTLTAGNAYSSESAWSGSGGGTSQFETEPSYQQSVQNTGKRTIPDVAFVAAPATGVSVYDSYNNGSAAPWWVVGGTSLAAPSWAGLIAIANQGRVADGGTTLNGFGNPTQALQGLYSLSNSDFHDITTGSNGGFTAGPGYDEVTGRGTPIADKLIPDLIAFGTIPTVTAISPTSGYVTGGTSVTITGANFTPASTVKFGTTAATSVTVNSGTSITAIAPPEAEGTVDVTVTTAVGTSKTSSADQFTYGPAITITRNPKDQTVFATGTATFTAAATGIPLPTVQWQVSSDDGNTWTDIGGATNTTLTLSDVPLTMNGNEYQAVFTNSTGSLTTTAATLTVTPSNVATTASNVSADLSPNAQTVTLNATLANTSIPANTVEEGTVTFTILEGDTVIGTPVQGTVSAGQASASFDVPAALASGNYTIEVGYTDSEGNLIDNSDTNATLTIAPAHVTTTATAASAFFSPNAQTVTLNATLANTSIPANTVGAGSVTFTVMDGGKIIGKPVQGTVSGGKASAAFDVPAGLSAGNYTVEVAYSDGPGPFADNSDTNATLTIAPANVTLTAANVSPLFSRNAQTVMLNATLADTSIPGDSVDEGSVTFTILQGSTIIGTVSTSDTVSNSAASVRFVLPAGTAAGSYTINAVYNPGPDFTTSTDIAHTLDVGAATTTTMANNVAASFSVGARNVTLNANVASLAGPVNEGTVTFTLLQGNTVIGSATTSGTVSNGTANVSYALPAGTAAGNYTIDTVYNPGSDFATSSDNAQILTLATAATTTTASNVTASFSASSQTVTLIANVTSNAGPVNEGTVTFTLLQGNTPLGTAVTSSTVSNNQATVSYVLPAGASAGNYTIDAVYNPGPDFGTSSDTAHTAVLMPSNVAVTASNILALYNTNPQVVTLNAAVANISNPSTLVNEGVVNFTLKSGSATLGTVQGAVTNGNASAAFGLLAGLPVGNYSIAVSYSGSQGHFTDFTDNNALLTVQAPSTPAISSQQSSGLHIPSLLVLINEFVGGTETRNADGTVTITYSLYGMTLLTANYDSAGNFVSGSVLGINVPNWLWFV